MAIPQENCESYWKLENVIAEIGPNFIASAGVTWDACKFNNGAKNITAGDLTASNAISNVTKFIFSTWVKTPWSMTGGQTSAGIHCLFSWRYNANNRFYIYFLDAGPYGGVLDFVLGGVYQQYYNGTNWNWSANSLNHIIVVVDKAGIDGGNDIVRFYLNKNLIFSSTVALGTPAAHTGTFYLLDMDLSGFVWNGIIDECKINTVTTQANIDAIRTGSDYEGFPVSNTFRRGPVNYINNFPFNRPFARVA